jgi:hypothetical protein
MRAVPPSPNPPIPPSPSVSPSVTPAPDQTIDVTVLPPTPTQTPVPSPDHTTVAVTIPQEIWDKLTSIAGGGHCRPPAIGGFLCENGETFSHVASAVSSLITALAVIIGGSWAYRKFVRGRTFQPRSLVEVSAQWHVLPPVGDVLQVRIRVTNIGGSKLNLLQDKTGLRISFPAEVQTTTAEQRSEDPWWTDIRWEYVPEKAGHDDPEDRLWAILRDNDHIEPGETVFDDKLLNLNRPPTIVRIEAQLAWKVPGWWRKVRSLWRKSGHIYDYVIQIMPPETVIHDNQRDVSSHDTTKEDSKK